MEAVHNIRLSFGLIEMTEEPLQLWNWNMRCSCITHKHTHTSVLCNKCYSLYGRTK